ncbi:MAG: invasion associated locus B family protein [bacterium]|nr:invasion associated locus B family protein [bacterium]
MLQKVWLAAPVAPIARLYPALAVALALLAGGILAALPSATFAQAPAPAAPARANPATKPKATEQAQPAPQAAPAQPATPSSGPEKINSALPAWTTSCGSQARSAAPDCKLEQRVFAKETSRLLSAASIVVPGNTRQPMLLLQLVNGLAIQQGVSVNVDDGAATPVMLQSCDGNGCYATLALTPALLESMRSGKVMTVKATVANRETLAIQHLLTDFAAAFDAVK